MINLNTISEKLRKNSTKLSLLLILVVITALITYYRVKIQIDIGPIWDTYDFLSNALVFAGNDMRYSDLTRPPVLPFITSIFFRMNYASEAIFFVIDGVIFIFGVIGLYLLLNYRFSSTQSFLGGLLFATFPVILTFIGSGFTDLASVSITIWTFYFLILAVKKDSKFFYLVFPLAMLAFLTRYASALIIFPIFLYILMNKDKINIKNIFTGIFASFLLLIPVFIFFYEKFGDMLYPFMSFFRTATISSSPGSAAYDPNLFFFIEKLPLFIGPEGILTIFIILTGILVCGFLKFKGNSQNEKKIFNGLKTMKMATKLKLLLFIGLILIFIGSFGQIFYMWNEVLFFIIGYLFYDLTKNLNIKNTTTHLLFFTWFMAFFIFHSIYAIKDNRYFILMAPAVTYFLILGLSEISNQLKIKIKSTNLTFPIFSIILIFIILPSTSAYIPSIQQSNNELKVLNENTVLASEWLINYDPNYKTKIIYSDIWPYSGWYLKMNIRPMPTFKDNQTFYYGVKNYTFNQEDSMAFNQELYNNKADYYFSVMAGLNLTSYKPIKQFGNLIIYARLNSKS